MVKFAALDPDGSPEEVLTLGPARRVDPVMAVDAAGRATVAWATRRQSGGLRYVRVSPAGKPGPVQELAPPGTGIDAFSVHVAAGPAGDATISWAFEGIRAVHISADGSAGPIQRLSSSGLADGYDVGADIGYDGMGRATLAWADFDPAGPAGETVKLARLDPNGIAGPVEVIAEHEYVDDPVKIGVDESGTANVAFTAGTGNRLVRVRSDGTVEAERPLGTQRSYSPIVDAAVDNSGLTTFAFALQHGGRRTNQTHFSPATISVAADGSIGPVRIIRSRVIDSADLPVDIAAGARTFVTWTAPSAQGHGTTAIAVAQVKEQGPVGEAVIKGPVGEALIAGRGFGSAVTVTDDGRPAVAFNGRGGLLVRPG